MIGGIGAPIGTPIGGVLDQPSEAGAGIAALDFVVAGIGDGQTSLVGSAVLQIVVDGRIEALPEGAGAAEFVFTTNAAGDTVSDGAGLANFALLLPSVHSIVSRPEPSSALPLASVGQPLSQAELQ